MLLYPLYHPAAALYTPAMLKILEEDFARLPQLLGLVDEPEPGAGAVTVPDALPSPRSSSVSSSD